jgi:hypothetical protein
VILRLNESMDCLSACESLPTYKQRFQLDATDTVKTPPVQCGGGRTASGKFLPALCKQDQLFIRDAFLGLYIGGYQLPIPATVKPIHSESPSI